MSEDVREQGVKLAASYATKSGSTLLPDQVPRPQGSRFSGQKLMKLSRDPRRLAIGYSVRPSRVTTVTAPGRA